MRFTFSILVERALAELGIEPLFLQAEEDAIVKRAVSVTSAPWPPECLCILNAGLNDVDQAVPLPKTCLYIASADECADGSFPPCPQGNSLVVLPADTDSAVLQSAVEDAFVFYNDWYDNMLNIIRGGENWFALLDEGHRVLRNPIILYDRSMKVLAYTRDDRPNDAVWDSTVGSGTIRVGTPTEATELLRYISRLDQYTRPFKHAGDGLTNPFYSSNIISGGVRCGQVTEVEFNHPLSTGDLELLQIFTELAALRIQSPQDTTTLDAAGRQLIHDLLAESIASPELLATRLLSVHWQINRYFRLLLFRSTLPFMTEAQWRQVYAELMQLRLNGLGCLLGGEETKLCLLVSTAEKQLLTSATETLKQFCLSHRLRCGCSNSYENLLETPRYRTQADAALTFGKDRFCSYSEVRFTKLLHTLQNVDYPQDLIHPAVLQLQQMDETGGTDYLRTLRGLMSNSFRQTDTAAELGIHRTTLLYRMNKIRELTGLNPEDSRDMLHVAVSIEMLSLSAEEHQPVD